MNKNKKNRNNNMEEEDVYEDISGIAKTMVLALQCGRLTGKHWAFN